MEAIKMEAIKMEAIADPNTTSTYNRGGHGR